MPEDRHGNFLPSPHACLMPCHGSVDAMHCGNCFGKYAHQIHIQNENIPYSGDEHTRFKWVHDLLMHSWNGLLLEIADIHRHTMRRSNEWCWCNRNRTQTHTKSTNTNIYTHLMRVLPIEWAWATANLFVLCESRLFTFYPCHIINSFLLRGKVVLLGVFGVCLSHAFIHVRCASCHLAVVGLRCGLPMCWHWLFWDVPERASSIDTHNADSATNTQLASIECNCSLLTFGFVGYTGVSSEQCLVKLSEMNWEWLNSEQLTVLLSMHGWLWHQTVPSGEEHHQKPITNPITEYESNMPFNCIRDRSMFHAIDGEAFN